MLDTLLVPQGAEYRAVCRGLASAGCSSVRVLPIPAGPEAVSRYLHRWQQTSDFLNRLPSGVLLAGLGGSLSLQYRVGEVGLYRGCWQVGPQAEVQWHACDASLTESVRRHLSGKVSSVAGLTSDRPIVSAAEKSELGQAYGAEVVDMEGAAVLEACCRARIPATVLRAIGDDCQQELPDLRGVFSPDGQLQVLPLAVALACQPAAGLRLMRTSWRGLKVLEKAIAELFSQG